MPTVKLTDAAVQRLKAPPGGRVDYFDAAYPGLALRVTGAVDQRPERRTWTLFYRFGGKQMRLTFEPGYPALGLADARDAANKAKLQLQAGADPRVAKAAVKAEAARAPNTMENVVDQFIKRGLEGRNRAPGYIEGTRRTFNNHIMSRWKDRDIKSITQHDMVRLLDEVMEAGSVVRGEDGKRRIVRGGPIAANRTLAALRAFFNFALRRGTISPPSPAALVERPGTETKRDRVLSAEEIRLVWETLSELGYPFGAYLKLVLLTAQRRDEVARMQRPNLDLSPPRPREIPSGIPGRAITIVEGSLWTLPGTETKNRHVHVVPLAPLAVEIIGNVPRKTFGGKVSPWIFTTEGDRPIRGYSKAKARLDKLIAAKLAAAFQEEHRRAPNDGEAVMARWTIHDLRRTASTEMRRLGVSRYDVERVINHADGTVGGVYDRYDALAEKRHALDTWASYLESLTRPAGGTAVALRGDGA